MEQGCRTVALAALAALALRTFRPVASPDRPIVSQSTAGLRSALARATRAPLSELHLTFDSLPGVADRAWARDIAAAGTRVRWRTTPVGGEGASSVNAAPLATAIDPLPDPSGRLRLVAIGTPGAPLSIEDAAGSVDSSAFPPSGTRVLDATLDGRVDVHAARAIAIAARRDSLVLRPVLVIGNAGWEGKFTVAALEEAGWKVDARFAVAPQATVRQGRDVAIDTAHYAAVVALDASARPYSSSIVRFVREGGGAVVAGEAVSLPGFGAILPARPAERVTPTLGAVAGDDPRRGLEGVALSASRNGAIVIDRTNGRARAVAARVGIARVVALGYSDTWRWRMEGGSDAPRLHRDWWSALVASVVRAPAITVTAVPDVDEAPYASLVGALGKPDDSGGAWRSAGASAGAQWWEPLLFAMLIGGLLAEWASRRLRGVR